MIKNKGLKKEIGKRLKLALLFKGVTQEMLSKRIKRTKVTMSRYVNGFSSPTIDEAVMISRELDMSLDEIFVPKDANN